MNAETSTLCSPMRLLRLLILLCTMVMPMAWAVSSEDKADASQSPRVAAPSRVAELLHDPLHYLDHTAPSCSTDLYQAGPLELSVAIQLALCQHPQLRMRNAAVRAQEAARGVAHAAWLPTLNASFNALNTKTEESQQSGGESESLGVTRSLELNWRIYDFGARSARIRGAESDVGAALAQHDDAVTSVAAEVMTRWWDALSQARSLKGREHALQLAGESLAVVQRREVLRAASRSEVALASAAVARAELAAQRARGDAARARIALALAIGLPQASAMELPDQGMPDFQSLEPDPLTTWLERAHVHPGIIAALAQSEAARQRVTQMRSDGRPTIDLTANTYQNGQPGQGFQGTRTTSTVGVALRIPVYSGFADTYRMREAQAQYEQSIAQLADTRARVLSDMARAHADLMAARRALRAAGELVSASRASAESVERRFRAGAADTSEQLDAQSRLIEDELELIRGRLEHQLAVVRLHASTGQIEWVRLLPGFLPDPPH